MKKYHIKYTVEFDVPIKIENSTLNHNVYDMIKNLIEQSIKTQIFYFKKESMSPYMMRAKNILISHETAIKDFQI